MIELKLSALTAGSVIRAGTSSAVRRLCCSATTSAVTARQCWIVLPCTSGTTTGRSALRTTCASATVRS